jgi:hypothetical protein
MAHLPAVVLMLALGARSLDNVPLTWKPTDKTNEVLNAASRALNGRKVVLKPFTDARENKRLIGRNAEDKNKPKDVTTKDEVGAWVSTEVARLLKDAGVAEGGDLVVSGEITRFFVDEAEVYRAVVAVNLTVANVSGSRLWTGLVTGEAKRWGRSYKEENYMEALSDALIHAVTEWVSNPQFVAAISGSAPAGKISGGTSP